MRIIVSSRRHTRPVWPLWALFAFTGLRRGSLVRLTEESFRTDGILVPHTKPGREWFLRYDDGCPLWRADLSAVGRRLWKERAPTPHYIHRRFQAVCADVGTRYTLHSLRHAFCSWLAMMGESLQDIAAWAHHSTVRTTEQSYAHLRPHGRDRTEENRRVAFTMRSHCLAKATGQKS